MKQMFKKILILLAIFFFSSSLVFAEIIDQKLEQAIANNNSVICFFASWSKPCQEEMVYLNSLLPAYEKKGYKIIGVSLDRKAEDLNKFIAENKINIPIIHDKKLKTIKGYKLLIIPTLLVMDKTGKITETYVDFDENIKKSIRI